LTGRAAFKEMAKAQDEALKLLDTGSRLKVRWPKPPNLDSLASVLCPACKLWNTGHGATIDARSRQPHGRLRLDGDCPVSSAKNGWTRNSKPPTSPEAVQRMQLSITMTNPLFLASSSNGLPK